FAAGDAGRAAHRVVEIEYDLLAVGAPGRADDVVDLHFAAGEDAQIAVDAGIELHCLLRMAAVGRRLGAPWKPAIADIERIGPLPQPRIRVMRRGALRLTADEQFDAQLPRCLGPLSCGLHLHARSRPPDAGGGEHPLALDLDHAGAAIAAGPVA